jgi:hypothetical protein
MKKTKITSILALILALLLIAGCAKSGAEPTPDGTAPEETSAPTDNIEETEPPSEEEAEPPAETGEVADETGRPKTAKFTISLEGMDEEVEMTLYEGDFSKKGGPRFTIYSDDSRYELISEEVFRFVLPDMKDDVFLDIDFIPGKTASEIAPGLLDSYEKMQSINDEGLVELGENIARHVYGQGEKTFLEGYAIDIGAGCVTIVLSAPSEYTEGHMARLYYMAETISFAK